VAAGVEDDSVLRAEDSQEVGERVFESLGDRDRVHQSVLQADMVVAGPMAGKALARRASNALVAAGGVMLLLRKRTRSVPNAAGFRHLGFVVRFSCLVTVGSCLFLLVRRWCWPW
jgi:hypothetical protein